VQSASDFAPSRIWQQRSAASTKIKRTARRQTIIRRLSRNEEQKLLRQTYREKD